MSHATATVLVSMLLPNGTPARRRLARTRSVVLILALVSFGFLGGCIDDDGGTPPATIGTGGEGNETANQTVDPVLAIANATFEGPNWTVGQWWAHHMYFGPEDSGGTHTNVYVAKDEGDEWVVATDNEAQARRDAQDDLFNLGAFGQSDLATTWKDSAWTWYQWPLSADSSWHKAVVYEGRVYHTDFRASFAADIPTARGGLPGFVITGTTAQGATVVEYDFVPEMGWFSNFRFYDISVDAENPALKIVNMGFGTGKSGQAYVIFTPEPLLEHDFASQNGVPSGEQVLKMGVPENTGAVSGIITMSVDTGVAEVVLEDPDGNRHQYTAEDRQGPATQTHEVLIDDPPAGEWQVYVIGAGRSVEIGIDLIAEKVERGTIA